MEEIRKAIREEIAYANKIKGVEMTMRDAEAITFDEWWDDNENGVLFDQDHYKKCWEAAIENYKLSLEKK